MEVREITAPITEAQVDALSAIFTDAFGQPPSDSFLERLNEKKDLSVLFAYEGEKLVGFKIDYTRFKGVFFSWLGAVAVSCRRKGGDDSFFVINMSFVGKGNTQKCRLRQHTTISQC